MQEPCQDAMHHFGAHCFGACTIVLVDNLWITTVYVSAHQLRLLMRMHSHLTGGGARVAKKFLLEPLTLTKKEN